MLASSTDAVVKQSFVSANELSSYAALDHLVLGVVQEIETSDTATFTIVAVLSGENDRCLLVVKNNASFLLNRIVVIDPPDMRLGWIANLTYRYRILAMLNMSPKQDAEFIECPECHCNLRSENLAKHLGQVHEFAMLRTDDKQPL
jgi:hypothetical protein